MGTARLFTGVALLAQILQASAQTWCGKHYMANQSVVEPGGEFPIPELSKEPLLVFRCAPAIQPYLADDSSGTIIIDTLVTNVKIADTTPIQNVDAAVSGLHVSISVNGQTLANGPVSLNASAHEFTLPLGSLKPQSDAFNVECTARMEDGQTFKTSTTLLRLPNRTDGGSVTKMDFRTGAMLVQNSTTKEWETVFPLGFYTTFDGYLANNLSVLNDLKDMGYVHPVPTFDNMTAFEEVLDRMEEVRLYLMYDMRFTYMNATSVTEQVNMIKTRKNLLLWYTGDEPDGTSDPLNATQDTYNLIKSLDGSYHPVSLVLNCENYFFPEYIRGADVVMQDTYPVAINATLSVEWHTPCTPDFGDCGCDDCKGSFADISDRMDTFAYRLDVLGVSRTKTVWAVPQAFGGSEYWARAPTGNEWLVESVLSINHGATGIVPWDDPTPTDIKDAATALAHALPTIKSFIFDPHHTFSSILSNNNSSQNLNGSQVDIGLWTVNQRTLVLATNMANNSATVEVELPTRASGSVMEILNSGGSVQVANNGKSAMISLDGLSSFGVTVG
ncbi:uncharacterized protein FOMMEDRAFT_132713 [Fomitiporia mediterranea MF3/22]|uniref:uncharacterized protein n=1 Tax=Fomitiporia mediterranea (strain MF3/22) TaxID=694068 RepID=UPI0004408744|nr:uncharacterized protein FOMMEDRAFT_132713 [Fomitiporia mediterranea MF3/22]EJD04861.1 hypothetical protein FOMMEDRAFT_132713 [Fomitiporia mediterranea MF3/22]